MLTRKELEQRYWRYYLMLEKRFKESIEYVELHKDNYNAFSNGYALMIQSIGAELDTVFKEFCGFNTEDRKTIENYAQYILEEDPAIINRIIVLQGYDMEIQPFKTWNIEHASQSLQWWFAFNKTKHNRFNKLKLANLENALNILGALYMIEMMYLKKITNDTQDVDIFDERSELFKIKGWETRTISMQDIVAMTY